MSGPVQPDKYGANPDYGGWTSAGQPPPANHAAQQPYRGYPPYQMPLPPARYAQTAGPQRYLGGPGTAIAAAVLSFLGAFVHGFYPPAGT
jgi:hypothetical protein